MTTNDDHDYLWDRTGPVDDDVAALERALAPLSAARNPRELIARTSRIRVLPALFAAASIAAAIVVAVWPRTPIVVDNEHALVANETITGAHDLNLGAHGVVHTESDAVVRVVENTLSHQELFLERGRLSALVDAPPRFFAVRTQSARAVDLGCAYAISVDDAHRTRIDVTSGAVVLEGAKLDVIVPGGASATAGGLPYRTGSPIASAADANDVDSIVRTAERSDAITLWYAALRNHDVRALDRLRSLSTPPRAVRDIDDVDAMYAWLDAIERDLDHNNPR